MSNVLYNDWKGLSPRVRGNQLVAVPHIPVVGSIPACAGEPATPAGAPPPYTVYPRVCGGTMRILLSPTA